MALVSDGKWSRLERLVEPNAKHPTDSLDMMLSSPPVEARCTDKAGSLIYHQPDRQTKYKGVVRIFEPREKAKKSALEEL
jgi:hypothetical protein